MGRAKKPIKYRLMAVKHNNNLPNKLFLIIFFPPELRHGIDHPIQVLKIKRSFLFIVFVFFVFLVYQSNFIKYSCYVNGEQALECCAH